MGQKGPLVSCFFNLLGSRFACAVASFRLNANECRIFSGLGSLQRSREFEAVGGHDAIIVIGSANSSNTMALAKLASEEGCERVYRINAVEELPDDLTGIVGVTAGASAPEELVDAVVGFLSPASGVELVVVTDEASQ